MTSSEPLRVAALPRDPNPYQALLYEQMAAFGVEVRYLADLTPSRTLNLLLLPGELLARRLRGLDVVHLHWVFCFGLPGRRRVRAVGLLSEAWFHVFLWTVSVSGLRLVWTAHNVLPHSPVFWDDVRARRALAAAADLVLVHDAETVAALAGIGAYPRATAVVAHGPFVTPGAEAEEPDAARDRPTVLAFVGAVEEYKGVEDLVRAVASLSGEVRLVVAGACHDRELAGRLRALAVPLGGRVELRLEWLPDAELAAVLRSADVLVLPYRRVTTSGTAMLGLTAGLPLVVPAVPALAGLPVEAVIRYSGPEGLVGALARVADMPRERLRAMGSAGRAAVTSVSWSEIARVTVDLMRDLDRPRLVVR